MSSVEKRLAVWLTREHFGELCSKVIDTLVTRGDLSLQDLLTSKQFDRNQLKKSLCTLTQHSAVDYKTNANGTVIYAARVKEILYRSRYPRYIDAARSLFGCRAQLIVADVVQHGRVRIGAVLERMRERETAGEGVSARDAEEETVEMFGKLVDMQYLCCAVVDSQVEG
jgi:hypothetical protein